MSRCTDFRIMAPVRTLLSVLPPMDRASIGAHAPTAVSPVHKGPDAPLPAADIVMFTWTSAEWSAMDHVFLHGSVQRESEWSSLTHKWLETVAMRISCDKTRSVFDRYASVSESDLTNTMRRVELNEIDGERVVKEHRGTGGASYWCRRTRSSNWTTEA
jgi:hypothetical protein